MRPAVLAALAALSLSACATEPTRFQPATSPTGVGYSELRIEPGRYRITFHGGPGASFNQVEDYALLRAADLALADGYDWFQVVSRNTDRNGYGGSRFSVGVGGGSYGRRGGMGVGLGTGIPLGGGPAVTARLEVLMGKGPRPEGRDVYDARGVRQSIGGRAI